MFKIFRFTLAALMLGALLALASIKLHFPMGWIGGIGLIAWAILARRKWEKIGRQTGLDPSGPERVLRLRATGTALLLGHLCAALSYPDLDFHVGQGNFLAIDSWTMIAAFIVAGLLYQQDGKLSDERDRAIAFSGTQNGYHTLIASLVVLLLLLGFLPPNILEQLNYFTVANILVALITLSLFAKFLTQLFGYAKDTQALMALDSEP